MQARRAAWELFLCPTQVKKHLYVHDPEQIGFGKSISKLETPKNFGICRLD